MIKTIIHGYNILRNHFRKVIEINKRSPQWRKLEQEHLEKEPACMACGSNIRLNVHHVIPFHIDHSKELDPQNLITLCMDIKECHLQLGHCGVFSSYNPNIKKDAAIVLQHPNKYDQIVRQAKLNKKD